MKQHLACKGGDGKLGRFSPWFGLCVSITARVFGAGVYGGGGGKERGGRKGRVLLCCFSLLALLLVHFLHFHPSVLKPDFDLSLTQVEESGHFVSTVPRQVHIE